jgi:hypothetical protein
MLIAIRSMLVIAVVALFLGITQPTSAQDKTQNELQTHVNSLFTLTKFTEGRVGDVWHQCEDSVA